MKTATQEMTKLEELKATARAAAEATYGAADADWDAVDAARVNYYAAGDTAARAAALAAYCAELKKTQEENSND